MSDLPVLRLVLQVDATTMTSYGLDREFNRGIKFRFDRRFLVNGESSREESEPKAIVKFMVSRKEVFYLFEVYDERKEAVEGDSDDGVVSERFAFKVRRFVLWEPVSLDILDDCVAMIRRTDNRLACFNIGKGLAALLILGNHLGASVLTKLKYFNNFTEY
jgi:hypothetical protein